MFGFSKKSDQEKENEKSKSSEEESLKKEKSEKQKIEEDLVFHKMPKGVKLGRPDKKEPDKEEKREEKKEEKQRDKVKAVSGSGDFESGGDFKTKLVGGVIIGSGVVLILGIIYLGYIYFIAPSVQMPWEEDQVTEELREYSLVVNVEGEGSVEPFGENIYEEGESVVISTDPDEGWFLDRFSGDCSGSGCELTMDRDMEVTAHFEQREQEYSLVVNVEGEGSVEPSGESVYEEGEEVVISVDPEEGWEFLYFSGDCIDDTCELTMDRDMEVTAHFEQREQEYSLVVNVEGEGSVEPSGESVYEEGEEVVISVDPEEGWEFLYFSGDCIDDTCELTMDRDMEVTAHFEEEEPEMVVEIEESCQEDGDCDWVSINCCPEEAGAEWACVNLEETVIECPGDVICPQVVSPKPSETCGCHGEECQTVIDKVLSEEEDEIFGTDPEKEDTDGDGYRDIVEILNLYDPLDPDEGRLVDNPNITKYTNPSYAYSLLAPDNWTEQEVDEYRTVIFKENDNVFISVIVQENEDGQAIDEWYIQEFSPEEDQMPRQEEVDNWRLLPLNPELEEQGPIVRDAYKWQGLPHPDEDIFYIADEDGEYIYTISLSGDPEGLYQNIFYLFINSFELS